MRLFLITAAAVAALALLYVVVCIVLGFRVMCTALLPKRVPPEVTRQKDSDNGCPECFDDYDNHWERHDFSLESCGAVISGEYIVNPDSSPERKKVAIICHGHTVSRMACLKYGRMFYKLGYNLIIFDERYFGKSKARCCTMGMLEAQDVKNIMGLAKKIFGEDCFIALHGESMGAATSLLVLGIAKPELVVADCPFVDTYRLMKYLAKKQIPIVPASHVLLATRMFGKLLFGYDPCRVNPVEAVAGSDVPICLIHGRCDTYVPCEHSQMAYDACRNPDSELHMIAGAGHARSFTMDISGYEKIIADFTGKIEEKIL